MDYIQLVLALCAMASIKAFDMSDPDVIFWVRAIFGVSAVLTFGVLGFIYLRIQSKHDHTELVMTGAELNPPQPLAAMMGQPAAPDANKQKTVTVQEYDMVKLKDAFRSAATPMAMVLFLHLWKGFMPPLVLQTVMPLSAILTSEIARIHLMNEAAKGDLKRPFKVKSIWDDIKGLKKELQQGLKDDGKAGRKNKKAANMKKAR